MVTANSTSFEIETVPEPEGTRVRVRGELDLLTVRELAQALVPAEREKPDVLIIDLEELGFMDLMGLRSVLDADRRARRDGRRLTIANPTGVVQRLFHLTGFVINPDGTIQQRV